MKIVIKHEVVFFNNTNAYFITRKFYRIQIQSTQQSHNIASSKKFDLIF